LPREPDPPDLAPDLELGELEGASADGARVVDAALARVQALVDCALTGCDLANADGRGGKLMRVSIERSRMTGVQLSESELRDVTIRGSRADLATFGFARLDSVVFEDCVVTDATFLEARLESVVFVRCDLTGADFRGARLEQCELRGCELGGLAGADSLRGAAIPREDIVRMAEIWAGALGIAVLDD
jgi:uncharacterized protein YjbI with pentapeptide repeats